MDEPRVAPVFMSAQTWEAIEKQPREWLIVYEKAVGILDVIATVNGKSAQERAELIAAAPELRDALEAAIKLIQHWYRWAGFDDEESAWKNYCNGEKMQPLFQALAKAKGEMKHGVQDR